MEVSVGETGRARALDKRQMSASTRISPPKIRNVTVGEIPRALKALLRPLVYSWSPKEKNKRKVGSRSYPESSRASSFLSLFFLPLGLRAQVPGIFSQPSIRNYILPNTSFLRMLGCGVPVT